jgi:hypothetical protein
VAEYFIRSVLVCVCVCVYVWCTVRNETIYVDSYLLLIAPLHVSMFIRLPKRMSYYRGADKSLARSGRKQATATEDFEFHISYL